MTARVHGTVDRRLHMTLFFSYTFDKQLAITRKRRQSQALLT